MCPSNFNYGKEAKSEIVPDTICNHITEIEAQFNSSEMEKVLKADKEWIREIQFKVLPKG